MSSRHLLFRTLYRLGFTPWDGHALARSLRDLIEGGTAPGSALDLGCGTGDNAIYLARHGWQVTAVDYVPAAVRKARAKAAAAGVDITVQTADVTRLRDEGVGRGFDLVIDSGCLHGMSDEDRDAYVREVTAISATDARFLIVAFVPGASFGVPGIAPADVERRFGAHWTLTSSGEETEMPARFYLFDRSR